MMDDLLARLEMATGPDREPDRLIEETLPGVLRHPHRDLVAEGYVISGEGHRYYGPGQGYRAPPYTESIEAAMSLVPEGWCWSVRGGAFTPPSAQLNYLEDDTRAGEVYAEATTPAIALCIAALKARTKAIR
jgi:hypothetical protein